MSGGDAKALEEEKQKNLSGTQKSTHPKDAPGWNETLAVSIRHFPLIHLKRHEQCTASALSVFFVCGN